MAKVNIRFEESLLSEEYYASKAFCALSLDKVINGTLDVRSSTYNGYQWDEIMSAMSDVSVIRVHQLIAYVKKFVFHFTAVCAKWTRTARSWWLNLYTGMPYDKLSFG